ncbi:MAG: polysaccharide deacetylase family protein [Candidatus Omnitrophota bacterium]
MKKKTKKILIIALIVFFLVTLAIAVLCVFFDEVVITRKGTIYRVNTAKKLVALTFDDGPSPKWTPLVLAELKRAGVKATFFMLGDHVAKYPEVAKMVQEQGHEIANHSYSHHVLIYYKTEELDKELIDTQEAIQKATGVSVKYFRPPKAWLTSKEKKRVKELGYKIILWSLNSKDWVTFDDKYIINFIIRNIRPGDIILFHDSGGVFSTEGGDRSETVSTIFRLVERLREIGFEPVTITELLNQQEQR